MKNKTKLLLTLLTYGLVIAFILILEFGSNELKNIACPIIAVAGAISSISALVYWFSDIIVKQQHLVVFYGREYNSVTTSWTIEELEKRKFYFVSRHETKDLSSTHAKILNDEGKTFTEKVKDEEGNVVEIYKYHRGKKYLVTSNLEEIEAMKKGDKAFFNLSATPLFHTSIEKADDLVTVQFVYPDSIAFEEDEGVWDFFFRKREMYKVVTEITEE
jgi:hypothetical protein